MMALYKKELRGLLPLFALVLAIFGSDVLYRPFAERLDEVTWVEQSGQLDSEDSKVVAWVFLILGLVAAYSAFPREHDEGTIEFLYALPIRRSGIFFAKVLAAWTVLVSGLVLDQCAGAVLQALNPQSWSGEQWRLGLAVRITLANSFFYTVILAHGLLISFLRRFGLLLYAMAGFAVYLVKKFAPGYAWLDPTEILVFEFRGATLLLPWTGLVIHGLVALVAGALAYALWMGRAERMTQLYGRLPSHMAGRLALGCVPLALTIGGFAWMVALAAGELKDAAEPVRYASYLPARAETLWYDFTYPASLSGRAHELIREADRAYEETAAWLDIEPGLRIDADLNDAGASHLGIAQGGVIRIALATLTSEEALMTLYHESVHAFQFELGDRRVAEKMNSLRFFVEGSAVFVTAELLPDPDARQAHRRLAAAAFDRHAIRFEELADNEAFTTVHDTNLVYVLGETWTAALAEECGEEAVGAFFRALDREDAPENLEGMALWQDTLRAAGCALEPVVARWGRQMRETVRQEKAFLEALPRLGGGVVEMDGEHLVFLAEPDRDLERPVETYYLRVRRDPSVSDDQVYTFTARMEADGSGAWFQVPRGWLEGTTFELQFGQSIEGSLWPFFEDWQAVSF